MGQHLSKEPIAIIGMSARLPGDISGPDGLWEKLSEGVDGITDVPEDRWNISKYYDPDPDKAGKIKSKKGGFIKGMSEFDAEFFDIYPTVAKHMDPRQRHLLEVTYEAIEDAGLTLEELDASLTAVTMGTFLGEELIKNSQDRREEWTPHSAMGGADTTVPARIAFTFNLRGPVFALDTACSSSLVAIHLACQSIWTGDADMAISGGVNIMQGPEQSLGLSKGGFLSPDGYCKTFDASGNGYVRGEGAGVIILKPLSQAEADGDFIYAVVRNTVSNSDGYTADGMTVPNEFAQIDMLKKAYGDVGINPAEVDFMEAHGTGTKVGDPKETYAFGHVFSEGRDPNKPLIIGSIKSNVGHTEAVAGVAGFMKLAQSINHKEIPRNLHFNTPNPGIKFDEWKLKVPTEHTPWPATGQRPARGGVNSFGAGGTNAHAVLEEYIPSANRKEDRPSEEKRYEFPMVFDLSAKSDEGLKATAQRYVDYLQTTTESLEAICYSLNKRRSKHTHRVLVTADSKEKVIEALQAYIKGDDFEGVVTGSTDPDHKLKIAFVCSGQGPQWYGMGRQLMQTSEVFRQTVKDIDVIFNRLSGYSLWEEMNKSSEDTRIGETRIAQPSIMAMQIGLIHMWKEFGIEPEGLVGHSIGEVAAAYGSGALTLEQAVDVIYNRSKEQDRASGAGVMLAVGQTLAEAMKEIAGVEDRVSIAAINGPEMLTLAGDKEPIEEIAKRLEEKEVFNKFLRVSVPFHSHHMEPLKEDLLAGLAHMQPGMAKVPLYSTVTGQEEDGSHLTSEYWYKNVRDTVYFTAAVEEMINDGYNVFVEIAPHPVLGGSVSDMLGSMNKKGTIITSARRDIKKFEGGVSYEEATFLRGASQMAITGGKVDWTVLFQGTDAKYIKLPRYAWQHKEFVAETSEHRKHRLEEEVHPLVEDFSLTADKSVKTSIFNLRPDKRVEKWLVDHIVDGVIVVPGTGQVEMANAVANIKFGDQVGFLEKVKFDQALTLPDEGPAPYVRLEITSEEGDYAIFSAAREDEDLVWTRHSTGKINFLGDSFKTMEFNLEEVKSRCTDDVDINDFYNDIASYGLKYGPTFRLVEEMKLGADNEIFSRVKLHESLEYGIERFHFHPALLDASLHTLFGQRKTYNGKKGNYLPAEFGRVKVYQKPDNEVYCYVRLSENSAQFMNGDFVIMNMDGTIVAEIQNVVCKYVVGSRGEGQSNAYSGSYQYQWEEADAATLLEENKEEAPAVGRVLVLQDGTAIGKSVVETLKKQASQLFIATKGDAYAHQGDQFTLKADDEAGFHDMVNTIMDGGKLDKVVYLWGLDVNVSENSSNDELIEQTGTMSYGAINLVKAVVEHDYAGEFWFVTQGADQVDAAEVDVNFGQGSLNGISRVLVNEYTDVKVRSVDVDRTASQESVKGLLEEIKANGALLKQTEVAYRGDKRFTRVLAPVSQDEAEASATKKVAASGSNYRMDIKEYGVLSSIGFREVHFDDLAEDQLLIDVKASGINFKDVANGLGILNKESVMGGISEDKPGLEVSGIVRSTGSGVSRFKEGDEVVAWVPYGIAGQAIAQEHCVVAKPSNVSWEVGASAVVVGITAHYGLNHLARMEEGERVLIHSATGGLGLAAIQLAKQAGAEIFATSGTEEKRQYLRDMGIKYVYDSRNTSFYSDVMRDTNGEGVDIVLNSLSGDKITQSLKTLRAFGRYVDVGKVDAFNNRQIGMKRLAQNISFHIIDADWLMKQRPKVGHRIFAEVMQMYAEGKIQPHPITSYPAEKVAEALQEFSKGNTIGKMVLTMEGEVEVLPAKEDRFKANASYLVTGGASGLGLAVGKWLADNGARNLILVSRSGTKSDRDAGVVKAMEAMGVTVALPKADVSDRDAMARVLEETKHMPPLKGIVHSAGLLDDAPFPNQNPERFMRVFKPKVLGAWNLHQLTKDGEALDFFVNISSISAVFGLPAQSNYSSGNNFLDKLSLYRRANGMAGSAVNFGVLSGQIAGMSAAEDAEGVMRVLHQQGWDEMTPENILGKIGRSIVDQAPYRVAADLDWKRFGEFFYHLKNDSRFKEQIEQAASGSGGGASGSLLDQLRSMDAEGKQAKLQEEVQGALAKILGTSADKIDTDKSISKIGLDSLMLNQLRNWIQTKMETNFPLMKIAKGPTIIELSTEILKLVSADEEGGEGPSNGAASAPKQEVQVHKADTKSVKQVSFGKVDGMLVSKDRWLASSEDMKENASTQFLCMHPMGATYEIFVPFMLTPPEDAKLLAFQQPGRGKGTPVDRTGEEQFDDLQKLINEIVAVALPMLDRPTFLWGHSMGGVEMFEVAHALKANHPEKFKNVKGLIVSASGSPSVLREWINQRAMDVTKKAGKESDSDVDFNKIVEGILGEMGGVDDEAFVKSIAPMMAKDLLMMENYNYPTERGPLNIPILGFTAQEDVITTVDQFKPWEKESSVSFEMEIVHGDHWFLSRNQEFITQRVETFIEKVLQKV